MIRACALSLALACAAHSGGAQVLTTSGTGAVLRALDKVSGQTMDVEITAGGGKSVFRLEVDLADCRYPADNPTGDAFAYLRTKEQNPRRVARIIEAVNSYDRLLRVLSVRHEHVVQGHPRLLQALYSIRKLSLFVVRLPLALLGIFLNVLPFFLTRLLSRLKIRQDRQSTAKLFGGLILYPLCWSLQAHLLGTEVFPPLAWWLLAPLSGVASLLFRERHAQLLEELRTYLKLNTHAEMRQELAQRLDIVRLEVAELLAFDLQQRALSTAGSAPGGEV